MTEPKTDAADDAVVRFRNIRKTYGDAVAVDDLSLDIQRGDFVTLLGPSGCGKSTTLRMLGGFETPDQGEIIMDGRDITVLPPNRRNVNIVFQDYALFPHLSVARNVAFGLEMAAMPRDQIAARVDELLALVRLESYGDRMPSELSGGQRQRIALIRALAPDPQVLLLDEPLSALDANLRQQMQVELKSIQAKTGTTFLFVTHDQEEALTMSDKVVVMNKGRIEQIGDPQTIYRHPRSRFVASFIGEANFLKAKVLGPTEGGYSVDWAGAPFIARAERGVASAGDTRSAVIRPELVIVNADRPADAPAVQGRIISRVFRGSQTSVTIAVPNGDEITASLGPAALTRLRDDDVWVGWDAGDAVVLRD